MMMNCMTDLPDLVMTISVVKWSKSLHRSSNSSWRRGETATDGTPGAGGAGDRRGRVGVGRSTAQAGLTAPRPAWN